jgi:acetate kinase
MRLLIVNAGSSSLKLRLLDDDLSINRTADLEVASADDLDADTVGAAISGWPAPDVVGHRVVHGGTDFSSAVLIDDRVARRLAELTDLAPLHQPKSLAGLRAVSGRLPGVPAVACFDTAFHATIPDAAALYAVPEAWRQRGVRRYGFHGLSHAYASRRGCELAGIPVQGSRVVTCHLGAGASLCAVRDGQSVDTTMGFTPLEGLVMATRSGTVDPGLVLWLEQHEQLTAEQLTTVLEKESGLLALAGTADLREVQAAADRGEHRARTALDVYLHRLVAGIASMVAALGGLDLLVFTGGVGENAGTLRQRAAERLGWLGVGIDRDRNASAEPDRELSAPGAAVTTVVVRAREDLQMAREIAALDVAR